MSEPTTQQTGQNDQWRRRFVFVVLVVAVVFVVPALMFAVLAISVVPAFVEQTGPLAPVTGPWDPGIVEP